MGRFVNTSWAEKQIDSPEVLILDPRPPIKYLQGHLKNAVNLPVSKCFDSEGGLRGPEELTRSVRQSGLDNQKSVLVYDAFDGQNGAMLAFILEYLGCADIYLMETFFEGWVADGREIFYRPVQPPAGDFKLRINPSINITQKDILADSDLKLIDFREREEFTGEKDTEGRPGHIPGAVNIVWLDLLGENHHFLASEEQLKKVFSRAGISAEDRSVAYCRMGPRAAVGYLALRKLGYRAALYCGSYAEWSRTSQPVEE